MAWFLQPGVWRSTWWGRSGAGLYLFISCFISLCVFAWLSALRFSSGLAAGGCSGGWRNYLYFLLTTPASASVAPSPGNRAANSAPVEASRAEEFSNAGYKDVWLKEILYIFTLPLAFLDVLEPHWGTFDISQRTNPEMFTFPVFSSSVDWVFFFFFGMPVAPPPTKSQKQPRYPSSLGG